MDKLKKDNIWRFVEGLNLDLRRRQLIGKLIEEIVDSFVDGVPAASNDNIGGIKTGYTQNEKNYPVTLDENKKAYVNVPWTDNNTTYEVMTPATANTAGKAGLVPAPKAGDQGRFLQASGGWGTPANTTYSKATDATLGLVKIGYTTNGKNYPVLLGIISNFPLLNKKRINLFLRYYLLFLYLFQTLYLCYFFLRFVLHIF